MSLAKENKDLRQECVRLHAAHEQSERSVQHYFRLFDLRPSASLTLGPDGAVAEANRALAEMLGTTLETLQGKCLSQFVFPDDHSQFLLHLKDDSPVGSQTCSDFRLIRSDGSTLPVMMQSVRIFPPEGHRSLLLADLRDITARRRTEEALQHERDFNATVLRTSGALIIVLDGSGRIRSFNQACERTSGYSAAEVLGLPFWDIVLPKEQVGRVRETFRSIGRIELPLRYENHWITKTGELRLISWANSVLRTEDGTVRAIVGSGLDITERRRLEAEILEIAEREQRRIGTDLHDGLGQQLTAMSLMCENLREELEKYPEFQNQAAALGACLREAIGFTRTLSHGLMLRNLEVEGLRGALESLAASTAAVSPVICEFHCETEVEIPDIQMASHLYHIAQEALNNALRHGAPTRIDIRLSCQHNAVHLWIRDNGTGFPAKSSSGIGLAAMKYRANIMGGALNVSSVPGSGVTIDCVVFFAL